MTNIEELEKVIVSDRNQEKARILIAILNGMKNDSAMVSNEQITMLEKIISDINATFITNQKPTDLLYKLLII